MENQNAKCSSKKHADINAISYCPECKKYLCKKCLTYHEEMEDHKTINLKEKKEIFFDKCNIEIHNAKLEFYCKEHNTLCCVLCTSKIKDERYGQHSDCNIRDIKDIKDEKRNKLKENINNLEELSKQINESINKLKEIFEQINKNKEELKLKVQRIFTKLKVSLDEKEKQLYLYIDKYFNETYFKEDIIKKSEKLPNKITKSIDKGKIIDKEWNENNLTSLLNDCINIENNIKEINTINDNIKKYYSYKDIKIYYNITEEQVNNMTNYINNFGQIIDNLYDDYNIANKNPIHKLANHTSYVNCLCLLNYGRLVSGSSDCLIIVYNKSTYQPDLTIKEHKGSINCVAQLSSGLLASCSGDNTIKLININGMKYETLQTLNDHSGPVNKIIELKNKNLVSCSDDSSIIFYIKDNNEWKKDYQLSTDGACYSIIQTKDNEICFSVSNSNKICFFSLLERKIKYSISNINKSNNCLENFIMIKKDLLLIHGHSQISFINIEKYNLVKIIDVQSSSDIYGVCMLNQNMILTGDNNRTISQWKIEGDNLKFISKKENSHDACIYALLNLGNGLIASGSRDTTIKIW